jgi:chromosome segregation ATPase
MEESASSSSSRPAAAALSASTLRELQQRAQAALAASREHSARLEADITRQLDELAANLSKQIASEQGGAAESGELRVEVDRLASELATTREAWRKEQAALEAERDVFQQHSLELEAKLKTSQEEWRTQLLDFETRLQDQQNSWSEQRTEWTATRADLERERDEIQQKFELALKDVQRLRERIAEMEHDLARRPEANQAASAELVALRAERDALTARVEELEQRPAAQMDADDEQQLADLQRRFELAVEDVRDLKTKNAKLESQLAAAASARPAGAPSHDAGGMDWESQKKRMLAALEGVDESDEAAQHERATIENTIEITDAVVAEKDGQIAQLTAELEAARTAAPADDGARTRKINELVDADEVIAEHRKRSQEIEREMEEKLRAAELEVSVERAKLARQKSELEELRANLEAQRQLYESTGTIPPPGAPRRRWLSKLGIDGKDKE